MVLREPAGAQALCGAALAQRRVDARLVAVAHEVSARFGCPRLTLRLERPHARPQLARERQIRPQIARSGVGR
jgi:hypothetical protein